MFIRSTLAADVDDGAEVERLREVCCRSGLVLDGLDMESRRRGKGGDE